MKCRIFKSIVFSIFICMIVVFLGYFYRPVWREWNNYDTAKGFYDQPDNTIETVFLGASIVVNGIIPSEIYREYGLCTYNLATELQPMLASYYWMKEAYRLHSDTLDTVVLDASMLRRTPPTSYYQKAIDQMEPSTNKWEAVGAYTKSLQEQISYFTPLFEYHSRWNNLNKTDFQKKTSEYKTFVRGYNYITTLHIENTGLDYKDIAIPQYNVDMEVGETVFNEEALFYFKQMMDFCNNHDIRLVLIKTPGLSGWCSENHVAVQNIAERYDIDFLDFNYDPLFTEIGFEQAIDTTDGGHPNYYGALKLTSYLGCYLKETCGNKDISDDTNYSFMKEELVKYDSYISEQDYYIKVESADEYLQKALENPDNVVFITAKDDAAASLTIEQRVLFKEKGLEVLSGIGYRDSYIGIIGSSGVVKELHKEDCGENTTITNTIINNDLENVVIKETVTKEESTFLYEQGHLDVDTNYEVKSGGLYQGCVSSCMINGVEYSLNGRGLNFVVYNKEKKGVINSRTFDTSATSIQYGSLYYEFAEAVSSGKTFSDLSGKVAELYLYNKKCLTVKENYYLKENRTDDGILFYLDYFLNRDNTLIYISAMDDAAGAMTDEARLYLIKHGFVKLAQLQCGDSYLGIIKNGSVDSEKSGSGKLPIYDIDIGYELISGGTDSGCVSSIKIDDTQYSKAGRGLNIVIYDTELDAVIDTECFDTSAYPMTLPENIVRTEVTE